VIISLSPAFVDGRPDHEASEIIGREMNEHERLAFGYRQKAVELRAMLLDFKDPESLERLGNLAAAYERLANVEDKLASEDKAAGKP
jgi:hypothetical protein